MNLVRRFTLLLITLMVVAGGCSKSKKTHGLNEERDEQTKQKYDTTDKRHSVDRFHELKRGMPVRELIALVGAPNTVTAFPSGGDGLVYYLMPFGRVFVSVECDGKVEIIGGSFVEANGKLFSIGTSTSGSGKVVFKEIQWSGYRLTEYKHKPANFARLKLGMSIKEVVSLVGYPNHHTGSGGYGFMYDIEPQGEIELWFGGSLESLQSINGWYVDNDGKKHEIAIQNIKDVIK